MERLDRSRRRIRLAQPNRGAKRLTCLVASLMRFPSGRRSTPIHDDLPVAKSAKTCVNLIMLSIQSSTVHSSARTLSIISPRSAISSWYSVSASALLLAASRAARLSNSNSTTSDGTKSGERVHILDPRIDAVSPLVRRKPHSLLKGHPLRLHRLQIRPFARTDSLNLSHEYGHCMILSLQNRRAQSPTPTVMANTVEVTLLNHPSHPASQALIRSKASSIPSSEPQKDNRKWSLPSGPKAIPGTVTTLAS